MIFIPIAFIFFNNQPMYCQSIKICNRYAVFKWSEFFGNMLGVSCTYNSEWWFLRSYVIAIVTFPIIRHIANKHPFRINIAIVVIADILVTNVFPAIGNIRLIGNLNDNYLYKTFFCQYASFIASFRMGVVVAKDNILTQLKDSLKNNRLLNPLSDLIILFIILFLRETGIGTDLDIIYVPLIIVSVIDLLDRLKIVRRLFLCIGKQSTNMWFIHSFFCYYFYEVAKIISSPKWAIPSLLLLILFSYIASIAVTYLWKGIGMLRDILVNIYNEKVKINDKCRC